MKKSLSLVVAAAMTLTTASVAFADAAPATTELSAQQKFDALKALGIFSGYPDGSAGLDKEMTRAEFAKVLTLLSQLEPDAAAAKVYTDVPATHWAAGFIGASTEAKLLNGLGANKFGPSGKVTIEQIAKVADLVAGVEPIEGEVSGKVSAWAKGYVAAAVKAGLLPELPSYQTNATRELLVEVSYDLAAETLVTVKSTKIVDEKNIEVTFSDGGVVKKTLDTALVVGVATKVSVDYNGKKYEVEVKLDVLKVSDAKQTGAKVITVNFNKPATDAEKTATTFELKNGLVPYAVTAKYADDNKSVALTATFLPAGEYTLNVKGSDPVTVKVEDEKVSKVDIGALTLQKGTAQDLKVKALNQFGEEVTGAIGDSNINVYNGKTGLPVTVTGGKVDLSGADVDSAIVVTALHTSSGLTATKTYKLVDASSATNIQLGAVVPLKDEARISVSKVGYVLPYTMADQYGQKVLVAGAKAVAGNKVSFGGAVDFVVSDITVIDPNSFSVDADGVVKFNTTAKAGTVVITAINSKTGATSNTTVKVEAAKALKTFQIAHPGVLVAEHEDVKIPYVAADTYGVPIDAKDVNASVIALGTGFNITSSNPDVDIDSASFNAKGELVVQFDGSGATTLFIWVSGQIASQVNIDVKAEAVPTKVLSVKTGAKTTLGINGVADLTIDQLNVVDNYGRPVTKLTGTWALTAVEATPAPAAPAADTSAISYATGKVKGVTAGTEKVTVGLSHGGTAVAGSTAEVTYTTVADADIKSFSIATIGTVYGGTTGRQADHDIAVTLVGKTASGNEVAIDQARFLTSITSSDTTVATIGAGKVHGVAKGTTNVAVWNGATKQAEAAVTVSDAAPVIASVAFDPTEINYAAGLDVSTKLAVKDQYGVAIAKTGTYASSDASKLTVSPAGVVAKVGAATGQVTVSFVSNNGIVATIIVNL